MNNRATTQVLRVVTGRKFSDQSGPAGLKILITLDCLLYFVLVQFFLIDTAVLYCKSQYWAYCFDIFVTKTR